MAEQREAITNSAAIKLIGCSATTFYKNHKKNLKVVFTKGTNVYYDHEAVKIYAKTVNQDAANYKIVS